LFNLAQRAVAIVKIIGTEQFDTRIRQPAHHRLDAVGRIASGDRLDAVGAGPRGLAGVRDVHDHLIVAGGENVSQRVYCAIL